MRWLSHHTDDDRGTGLTELSTVVTILGGISAVALIALTPLTADAADVACQANQHTVRMAGVAFESQHPLDDAAIDMAALVAAGLLQAIPPDVSYTADGPSFQVSGTGPCLP